MGLFGGVGCLSPMVWPFSRRSPPSAPQEKTLAGADRSVLEEAGEWFLEQDPGLQVEVDERHGLVVKQGGELVFMVRARAGKLTRVEVHAPERRPLVDGLVKEFEKRGTWSFNGVVRTVE